ncbi:MAG: hypothetical protein Q9181_000648 [Wetmoreana brouardii]
MNTCLCKDEKTCSFLPELDFEAAVGGIETAVTDATAMTQLITPDISAYNIVRSWAVQQLHTVV